VKNLRPSPAISVNSDTSIGEALRIMRENNVGSVLVNSYSPPHALEGIFTERDLLKWVGEIQKNNAWDKSIATIMSKKLITLDLLDMERAAEIMLEHGFRHVPIVYETGGASHVAGVISMRDLFKSFVVERKQKKVLEQHQGKRVLVLAHSSFERELQKKLLKDHVDLVLVEQDFEKETPDPRDLISRILASDLLVLDLDHFKSDFWVSILKGLLAEKERPPIFLVYDPVLQEAKNIVALKQLSQGSVIQLFPKPINLLEYLRLMERGLKSGLK
jgi:CBS domain-containing protein